MGYIDTLIGRVRSAIGFSKQIPAQTNPSDLHMAPIQTVAVPTKSQQPILLEEKDVQPVDRPVTDDDSRRRAELEVDILALKRESGVLNGLSSEAIARDLQAASMKFEGLSISSLKAKHDFLTAKLAQERKEQASAAAPPKDDDDGPDDDGNPMDGSLDISNTLGRSVQPETPVESVFNADTIMEKAIAQRGNPDSETMRRSTRYGGASREEELAPAKPDYIDVIRKRVVAAAAQSRASEALSTLDRQDSQPEDVSVAERIKSVVAESDRVAEARSMFDRLNDELEEKEKAAGKARETDKGPSMGM